MRQWKKREDKKRLSIDASFISLDFEPFTSHQYSFVGPLSMQKGCDQAFHMYTKTIDSVRSNTQKPNNGIGFETNKLSYRGMNYFLYWLIHADSVDDV